MLTKIALPFSARQVLRSITIFVSKLARKPNYSTLIHPKIKEELDQSNTRWTKKCDQHWIKPVVTSNLVRSGIRIWGLAVLCHPGHPLPDHLPVRQRQDSLHQDCSILGDGSSILGNLIPCWGVPSGCIACVQVFLPRWSCYLISLIWLFKKREMIGIRLIHCNRD